MQQHVFKYTGICFNSWRKKLWVCILNPQPSIDCAYVLGLFIVSSSLWPCGLSVACQAPLSVGFSRQEYWSELPCPPPVDLPHPGIEPVAPVVPALQADSLPLNCRGSPVLIVYCLKLLAPCFTSRCYILPS